MWRPGGDLMIILGVLITDTFLAIIRCTCSGQKFTRLTSTISHHRLSCLWLTHRGTVLVILRNFAGLAMISSLNVSSRIGACSWWLAYFWGGALAELMEFLGPGTVLLCLVIISCFIGTPPTEEVRWKWLQEGINKNSFLNKISLGFFYTKVKSATRKEKEMHPVLEIKDPAENRSGKFSKEWISLWKTGEVAAIMGPNGNREVYLVQVAIAAILHEVTQVRGALMGVILGVGK